MRTNRASIEAFTQSENEDTNHGIVGTVILIVSLLCIACTMPLSLFICIKVVQEYERAVIFRLGRLSGGGAKGTGPGIFFIIPCIDSYTVVDLRTITFDVPVLTKDSVTVSVDAVIYYRIWLPTSADKRFSDSERRCRHILSHLVTDNCRRKRTGLRQIDPAISRGHFAQHFGH
ncbi:unnamed protein product [Oppiella nova]|uniref:Band 7 domain-containing protein n=1 Tax=Oppiella nova TaxID=334625 RepID=A0A7R9QQ42_9ACAR|nr:unnamed protein product [Oppiella nova]CAG2170878.1 unnamed protein product [Oppiella nova]